jgi:hypothetical protein
MSKPAHWTLSAEEYEIKDYAYLTDTAGSPFAI